MLAVISAGLLVVAAVVLFRGRAPSDSGQSVRDWWTRKGVDKPNVVLISLDTTRADHLGCYGNADARTPAIDGLARRRRPVLTGCLAGASDVAVALVDHDRTLSHQSWRAAERHQLR